MRALFLPFLASACFAAGADLDECVLLDAKDAAGRHVQFRYAAKDLSEKKPHWTPGGPGPPLSLEEASKIAYAAAVRQSPEATGVSYGDIKLLRHECHWSRGLAVAWFWDFSVSPVVDPHPENWTKPPIVLPARDIVILLDGEVVQPTPVK